MPSAVSYRARFVIPVDRPPIPGGVVTVADGRIVAVGEKNADQSPRDLGDVALLPGLINAHTHLEFSLLEQPLGQRGMSFPDWIATIVQHRREQNKQLFNETDGFQRFRRRAAQAGLAESRAAGVAALGDIATLGWPRECFPAAGINSTIFLELIGLEATRLDSLMASARSFVQDLQDAAGDVRPGLSPHAPYTASPQLIQNICEFSAAERFPVAMHLAESRDELELLENHSGRLVEVLCSLSAWHPEAIPLASKPLHYLQHLAAAHRALVIHGNYLTPDEIEFIAAHRDPLSVVYCPRTHSFFKHDPYPLASLLAAGVRVAVGTDSRASNPDLRMWEELRHVAAKHPDVSPDAILKLGTLAAAEALGIERDYGSITPGKRASFALVPLNKLTQEPLASLLESSALCSGLSTGH